MINRKEPKGPAQPVLNLLYGTSEKKPRPLDRDAVIIGRARGCDIWLDAPDVSNLHCVITKGPRGLRVRDCGSRAGVKVNGEQVQTALLNDGDLLQIGPFSFQVAVPPQAAAKGETQDPRQQRHLQESRSRLGQLALKWRRRCRAQQNQSHGRQEELEQKANNLRERIRTYDERFNQLEEAERELEQERTALGKDREAHRDHVQKVEDELARHCQEVDEEIHGRYQEFQQRCQKEEERRQVLEEGQAARGLGQAESELLRGQQEELDRRAQQLGQREQQQAHYRESLQQEREECLRLQADWSSQQAAAAARAEQDRQARTQAEQLLSQQGTELARLLAEFQQVHQHWQQQQQEHDQALAQENEQLHQLLAEREQQHLAALAATPVAQPGEVESSQLLLDENIVREKNALEEENAQLRQQLEELVTAMEKLRQRPSAPKESSPHDLENYEAELNEFRRQLEEEWQKVKGEREQLQDRQAELDEATRELEMQMARERAEMAREGNRLDRLREEIRADQEKAQREGALRESLAPVQRLREGMQRKQPNPNSPTPKNS